ncbi:4385_t:CDS:2 [Entrophospora sp. SA101]|nr:4385_t:CDS:2 [Entrophospora sp. SA101]CAJ0909053.1 16035_t:CDS:2 [Entrophospora sp. SA101]
MKNLLQFLTLPKLLTVSIQNLKPNPNYTKLVVAILDIALSNHIDLALANSALSFLKTLPVSYQMILLELSLVNIWSDEISDSLSSLYAF